MRECTARRDEGHDPSIEQTATGKPVSHLLKGFVTRLKKRPNLGTVQREVLATTRASHRSGLFYS
jgi:hypothetical protein